MDNQLSFDDIKLLFAQTARQMAETDKRLDQRFAETDKRLDQRFAALTNQLAESDKRLDQRIAETDKRLDQRIAERHALGLLTDRKLSEIGKQVGALSNRLGDFVEGIMRPGLVRVFREWGLDVHRSFGNVELNKNGVQMEIDSMVTNDSEVILIEVKSKLSTSDVDQHLERLSKLRVAIPEFAAYRVMGAMAALLIPDSAKNYAEKLGFFVLGQRGDDLVILNRSGFEPTAY